MNSAKFTSKKARIHLNGRFFIRLLQQIAQTSGLVWVNSDQAKVAAVQAAIAAEPQPVRVPRERPAAVVVSEGPLVLVETRKDLNQLQVPF